MIPAEHPAAAFAVDLSRIELITWAPLITLTVLLGVWPGLLLHQWVAACDCAFGRASGAGGVMGL